MQTTISSKGQITVPKLVRDALHLKSGDKVRFFVEPDGSARVVPVKTSVRALRGILPRPERARTLAEMQEAIEQGASGT